MNTGDINFSIIIPHKNCPLLLQRCIDSIPIRKDLEVIIVDNNSSPEIVDFNNFPGSDRGDIKLIRDKISIGGGGARNTGLSHARGKWILFIDSDDYFNYSIRTLLDKYVNTDNDVIWFKVNSVDSDTYENREIGKGINKSIDYFQAGEKMGENKLRYGMFNPWGKMIKHEFLVLNSIQFEDTIVMNDVMFAYTLGYRAKKISVENVALLCIADRKNSVSKNWTKESYLERIRIKTNAEIFYKKNGIDVSYLQNNNYLFLFKYALHFPNDLKKAFKIMKNCGLSNLNIICGCLFRIPSVIIKKIFV